MMTAMRCLRCKTDNPPGARFCSACGTPLGTACLECGAALAEGQRFCTACGSEAPRPAATGDDGERRHATVMFSDLSGYTALNEALDPEEVEAVMSRIKADATAIVERHGGTVNQFVGDEVMALFGVPLARRHDARSAVRAALALHRAVDAFVATLASGIARSLSMHTGIHSGLVVARKSDARAGEWALTGDTVNTAARLRGLAAPGEILVGESTWRQVSDYFDAEAGVATEVKGKEQPLVAVRIRGERDAPVAGGGPVVGRDEELREFKAIAEACAERERGRVVVVRGDPGVGKSRLVVEFGAIATTLGFSCHSGTVLDFGSETGRDAVRSLARSLLGLAATADDAARRERIARAAEERALAAEQRLFLHDLLEVAPPSDLRALAAAMSTAARERGSLDALCALATSSAANAPLYVAIEDIHWADPWTLERLAALAALAARQPLVMIMTTRFAGDPTAGAWRTALHGAPLLGIDLAPLDDDDALRLAGLASSLPPDIVASCVARAEGNPLFLLQLLLDVGEAAQASLPGSIQALVHTRMDRLEAADKAALQAAAVLGQRFALDALRHLIEQPGYDCRVLVEHFLVRPDGGEFMFCHALIRDGAYASLLHARRRRLHARAGEWFGARDLALAAEHFDRAEDERAARAYLAASDALAAQFRYQAALPLAERGLAVAAERGSRFLLSMARAQLLIELGRTTDAIDACRAALDCAGDGGERARALIASAAAMRLNDRIAEGLAALDAAEPLTEEAGLSLELARLHHLRGNLLFPLGRHVECLREHEQALAIAREAGSLEAEVAALGGMGDGYYLKGRMRSAHGQFESCVALARRHGFGRPEIANLPMVGWCAIHLLELGQAAATAEEAIELARRASQPRAELLARSLLAWVDGIMRDRRASAQEQIAAALELVRQLGAKRFEAQNLGIRAVVLARSGERDRAREVAAEALAIARAYATGQFGPSAIGICALVGDDPEERLQLLAEGEAQLARGCTSHNHVWLRELAIDTALELRDWNIVEQSCASLVAYTADEPLPRSDFTVARARALVRFERDDRGNELRAELARLDRIAADAELTVQREAISAALAVFGAPDTGDGHLPSSRPAL